MDVHNVVPARFPPLRMTVLLAATALLEALVACWALGAGGFKLPLAGLLPVDILPQVLGGLALALAVFLAPFFFPPPLNCTAGVPPVDTVSLREGAVEGPLLLGHAAFAAVWQAAALGFALLVLSRLTLLTSASILQAGVWLALCALASILLAQLCSRAFAGCMFIWIVALPVSGYFLAELFLSGPGGASGWSQASSLQAAALRSLMHWLLSLSPGTALSGLLTGVLADGSAWSWRGPFLLLCILNALLAWRVLRLARRDSASIPPRDV